MLATDQGDVDGERERHEGCEGGHVFAVPWVGLRVELGRRLGGLGRVPPHVGNAALPLR